MTALAAGMDLSACLPDGEVCTLAPGGGRALIPTGIAIALPAGYEAQIRPRSGLAWKRGVTVLNAPGTIDADYRGEVRVLLVNHGETEVVVRTGDRIAQMVVARVEDLPIAEVDALEDCESRDSAGFGTTGGFSTS